MFVVISRRMMSTSHRAGNECQPTAYMSSHGKFCCSSLLRGCVVQAKFLLVSLLNSLPAEPESHNALVVICSGERRTPRITRRDTAQTERKLTRLVVTARLWIAVCIEPRKESCAPSTHGLSHHVSSSPALHAQLVMNT